jgi:hypothetical protein
MGRVKQEEERNEAGNQFVNEIVCSARVEEEI